MAATSPTTDAGWNARLRALVAKPEPGRRDDLSLGNGLYARVEAQSVLFFMRFRTRQVSRSGTVWALSSKVPTRRTSGVSSFAVTDARAAVAANRGAIANGIDPRVSKTKAATAGMTLAEAYKKYQAAHDHRREVTVTTEATHWNT